MNWPRLYISSSIRLSAIRINTVDVRFGHSARTKQSTKRPNAKYILKANVDENDIRFIYNPADSSNIR